MSGFRRVFDGRVLDVRIEEVEYPDGSVGELEIVRHPGAAAVLPVTPPADGCDDGTGSDVILLRQYRHAAGGVIWEVPAGKLDGAESPESCALRELREETGISAGSLRRLTTLLTTPGFTDERIHLYVATDLTFGTAEPEGHEYLEVHRMRLEEALRMVDDGTIRDGKTVACLLLAARRMVEDGAGPD